ncbi:MAG: aminotransferase class IV [Candidatus Eisenbacteria bacterium]|nr:aminotransferase class IV [Candidatus Eisenbacteria bacterium]
MIFYIRDSFVPDAEATIPVLDRGFLYGDSVYETLRSRAGRVLFWRDHFERLARSASLLEIPLDRTADDLLGILKELSRRNGLDEARMRIVLTRGAGGPEQLDGFVPTWVVLAEPFRGVPPERYEQGIAAILVSVSRHGVRCLNPEIKSSNLLNSVLARREALHAGAQEGIFLNPEGWLAEGAHSNLFWRTAGGALHTPALRVGILPGITRKKIVAIARELSIGVEEVEAPPEELERATEIFLTSTSWEAIAVTRYNGRPVGSGREGEWTRLFREKVRQLYDAPGESA